MNSFDKNALIAKPITRNKFKNLFIALVPVAITVFCNPTIYTQKMDRSQWLFYISYGMSLLSASIEVLLITELTERIKSKFVILNSLLLPQKYYTIFHFNAQLPIQRLNKIMNVHYDLIVTSKKLNSTFSFPIVATTANNFCLALQILYYSLQMAVLPKNLEATFQMAATSIWALMLLTQILIVVWKFTELAEEVVTKYLHCTVHKIKNTHCRPMIHQCVFTGCGIYT